MKIPTLHSPPLKVGQSLATIVGLLLTATSLNAAVIFQSDFNGPDGGTGGPTDMVTIGGTGAIIADGTTVVGGISNSHPFTPSSGSYLNVKRLNSEGTVYIPAQFTFASDANSWLAWQGADIPGQGETTNTALHAAFDAFFRINSAVDATTISSAFRPMDGVVWGGGGGDGLRVWLGGDNKKQIIMEMIALKYDDFSPAAISDFVGGPGASSDSLRRVTLGGGSIVAGVPYHVAFTLTTDPTGLTTAKLFVIAGTDEINPGQLPVSWASFRLNAAVISNAFVNVPWNYGMGHGPAGPFDIDYETSRIYDSVPETFTALEGTPPPSALIFQADYNGPGNGTGGTNNVVTLGGGATLGANTVNGTNYLSDANPFAPGSGKYQEVIFNGTGVNYNWVNPFTPVSVAQSWNAMIGAPLVFNGRTNLNLNGAMDIFVRPVSLTSPTDISGFRFDLGFSEPMRIILNGNNAGFLQFLLQARNPTANAFGTTPDSYTASSTQGLENGLAAMDNPFTAGEVTHVGLTFNTDTNTGLITVKVFAAPGTGPIDTTSEEALLGTQMFYADGSKLIKTQLNWPLLAAVPAPAVWNYDSVRLYRRDPGTFAGLSSVSAPMVFQSVVAEDGEVTLTWTGNGQLEWAPSVEGPWEAITPAPTSPYTEELVPGDARFYRLLGL
ncbi:MAG TPA: hypothetical protein VEH04_16160 [Verrucomicrobiae bacterium]|nr:hypothetical protein [Verrucomicrobiae bacterium]